MDLLPLRAVLVGGGPVPEDVLDEALGRGATVVQTYGLTETASQVTTLVADRGRRKRGLGRRPLLTTHLRIQDGEILVQGPTVAPGAPTRTAGCTPATSGESTTRASSTSPTASAT